MNENEALEFCKKWLPAWTGNKPTELAQFYTDEVFYLDPVNKKGLEGRANLERYLRKLLAANPKWKWEPLEIFPIKGGFILKWKASIPTDSRDIIEHGVDIVELADGKITRNEVYFDRFDWLSDI